jgi:hypothetical protein
MNQQISRSKGRQMRRLCAANVVDHTATQTQKICTTETKRVRRKSQFVVIRLLEQGVANEEIQPAFLYIFDIFVDAASE